MQGNTIDTNFMVEKSNNQLNLPEFLQNRIDNLQTNLQDIQWVRENRKNRVTLYKKVGPVIESCADLYPLHPSVKWVLRDSYGTLYLTKWQQAKIPKGYLLFDTPQSGRNYADNPPTTKEPVRFIEAKYPAGIDKFLRGVEKILEKYTPVGREAEIISKLENRLRVLKEQVVLLPQLSEEDLEKIVKENIDFLHENNFERVKNPEKRKISALLKSGFKDSLNRKNYLISVCKIYGMEAAILRRKEGAVKNTAKKYKTIYEFASQTREETRMYLEKVNQKIQALMDLEFYQNPEDCKQYLTIISRGLMQNVEVRPYVLGADKAIELFGVVEIPFGNVRDSLSKKDGKYKYNRPKSETVMELLEKGETDKAKMLIQKIKMILVLMLERNKDYMSVKPSRN